MNLLSIAQLRHPLARKPYRYDHDRSHFQVGTAEVPYHVVENRICVRCGGLFQMPPRKIGQPRSLRKYCSRSCMSAGKHRGTAMTVEDPARWALHSQERLFPRDLPPVQLCDQCGHLLNSQRRCFNCTRDQVATYTTPSANGFCVRCGGEFTRRVHSGGRPQRYCSDKCVDAANWARTPEAVRRRYYEAQQRRRHERENR